MADYEETVWRRIKRISCAMEQLRNQHIAELELTSSQSFVLCYLVHHQDGTICPKDLVEHFGLSHPTVSGILQRLEGKGFVTIETDADRRRKRITVTQKALKCNAQMMERVQQTEKTITGSLSADEKILLNDLLDRVIASINAAGTLSRSNCSKEVSHDKTTCGLHP